MIKNLALIAAVLAVSLCGARQAMADQLLSLINPPGQSDTPYVLTFTAGATTTDIQFEGYQVPSLEEVTDISLTSGGGNLLGETWTLTRAVNGSEASQSNDAYGTGTKGLVFAGTVEGDYDQFDQLVSTVVGQTYTLDFLFTNDPEGPAPSSLIVSASDTETATVTPEPASLFLFGSGLLGVMIAARRRRETA